MVLAHLLQNLDEEPDLHLCSLLKERIQRRSALGLAQHPKPLLDGAKLVLKVLIKSRGSHFLKRSLILVDFSNPLLCQFILRIGVESSVVKARLRVDV